MTDADKVHMMSTMEENVLCGSTNIYKYTTYKKGVTCMTCLQVMAKMSQRPTR